MHRCAIRLQFDRLGVGVDVINGLPGCAGGGLEAFVAMEANPVWKGAAMDLKQISDRDGFLNFMSATRAELSEGAKNWENINLSAFLEAMAAWAKDCQGPFSDNPWQHAAALIRAGAFYE